MPQALRAIRARVFGRCSASTLGRHAALVALALVLVLTAEAGASAGSRPKSHTVKTLSSETSVDPTVDCGAPAADPVPDGQDIVVTIGLGPSFTVGQIPSDWWQHPPYGDGVWQMQLRGFMWIGQLASRAYQDAQYQSLSSLVDQVLLFHEQDPDPGTATAASTADANAWGWDEGTTLRRLDAENCLYALTQDSRLVPVMEDDVAVQYGPRFYGPPNHAVHNHGIMADLGILRAADLLQRTDWQDQSIARLESEAPNAFTAVGTTREQSSSYHAFDVALWFAVADAIERYRPGDPSIGSIRSIAGRGDRVKAWLTEPDGLLTVFGDATRDRGGTRSAWTTRTFHDDAAGVAVGRWSWTAPGTTYYVIRYGPPRWGHGQQERGGVAAWSTAGRRVVVDPGVAIYDPAGTYGAYVRGVYSHNVAFPDGKALNTSAWVSLTSTNFSKASWQYWTTTDALFGVKHVRLVGVADTTHVLTVKDTFPAGTAFHQLWHLDPCWTLTANSRDLRTLVFKCGARTVTMTTTGLGASLSRGATNPVGGWSFPDYTHALPAYLISVRATGGAMTTWVVH